MAKIQKPAVFVKQGRKITALGLTRNGLEWPSMRAGHDDDGYGGDR